MAYFADMTLCDYHPGVLDANSWNAPLWAIGWVENTKSYPQGFEFSSDFRDRIAFLRFAFGVAFPQNVFRGLHECSLCSQTLGQTGKSILYQSNINLLVPGNECIYAAPGRIDHYMENHNYKPPKEFIEAIMNCPDPRADSYIQALKNANNSVSLPLTLDEKQKIFL